MAIRNRRRGPAVVRALQRAGAGRLRLNRALEALHQDADLDGDPTLFRISL